jgi:hypothetical protein
MPEKWELTVYAISHGCLIFAHIQVGGQGRSRGWGKAAESTKQEENAFTEKNPSVYALIVGLIDL